MQVNRSQKIVFLAPFGIRPKGTVLARMLPLAAELQTLGNEVVIVAPPYTNPEDSGRVEEVRGVRLVNVTLPRGGKALSTLLLAWRMFRAAGAEQPDLVHLFKPKGYGGIAAMLMIALRRLGVRLPPVIVDTDDWEGKGGMNELHSYSKAERLVFEFQERWLLQRADAVTVASRELEGLAAGVRGKDGRILYLPNCIEEVPPGDASGLRERLGIPPEAPVVLLYTRFFEFSQKKLHDVFAQIHRQLPGAHFVVVGKGRRGEEQQLTEAAAALHFDRVLHLVGWVEPAELSSFFALAQVAIYPFADNLLNRCKCPAKLTELIRAGVPVVADEVGQVREYIRNSETGVLCNPEDAEEMAQRTVDLLADPEQRGRLGRAGKAFLLERFNWKLFALKLNELYAQHISNC
jgi:glycosyltransferase involved in cell wall biosynthesis